MSTYALFENANSAAEDIGTFVTTFRDSAIKAFRNAAKTLDREEGAIGVWCEHRGREWYVCHEKDIPWK